VGENERQITIRTIGQEALQISKAEIQSRETTESSLMPVGLFETLTEQEVLDLVAYLRSAEQVRKPETD
jgi:putative heme-binding domain-containing protein